ncbi:MAG TPA: hypothetical protein PLV13_09145 [Ilumatobacteraceae bacterium]|nr:hypothetical protein [Ilumatobacteraceae bacterium]
MESVADPVAQVLAGLHHAVDQLLALDLGSLVGDELQQLVVGLRRERSRVAVADAQAIHMWQTSDVWRSGQALNAAIALGNSTRGCHRVAGAELGRARKLEHMSHTRQAVLEGRLSYEHVELFCRAATAERFALFLRDEELLVEQCARLRLFDDARRVLRYWADHADDELGQAPSGPAPSTLYMSRRADNGQAHLDGTLAAVDAEIVGNELDRLVRELRLEDKAKGVERTPAQRRATALVRMATRSAGANGVSPRPLFQVVVGDDTARRLCELASGVVVTAADLAPHIDTALMETFLFDGPTTVVAVSSRRTFVGQLRRAIQVRDRRCQHASGCPVPATVADIDHIVPAAHGGPTSQFNGRALCSAQNRHHHLRDAPSPRPERVLTALDQVRCRLRWNYLANPPPGEPWQTARHTAGTEGH